MKVTIKESVEDHNKTKKLLGSSTGERDILAVQLIRRNDEIGLLYEKIKILQTVIARGEVQYG